MSKDLIIEKGDEEKKWPPREFMIGNHTGNRMSQLNFSRDEVAAIACHVAQGNRAKFINSFQPNLYCTNNSTPMFTSNGYEPRFESSQLEVNLLLLLCLLAFRATSTTKQLQQYVNASENLSIKEYTLSWRVFQNSSTIETPLIFVIG